MSICKQFFYDFKDVFTIDEKLITVLVASLFLPYPITIGTLIIISIYIILKCDFRAMVKSVRRGNIFLLFSIYLLIVSIVFQNYLGALISVGIFLIGVCVIYFRKYISKDLFTKIIDMMIVLSLLSVIVSIFEQAYYMQTVEKMSGFLDIQNKPQHRVHLFYLNANYYAMMIIYVVSFCVYRFMGVSNVKRRVLYVVAGLCNLFALFLTGGRIAWLALAIGLLVMVLVNKWYKTFILAIAGVGAAVGILALKPGLIPRLAQKGLALGRRSKIYHTAMLMIQDNWIFGKGPLTYLSSYKQYEAQYKSMYGSKGWGKLGISAPHAHSMFLEPILSFGVLGTLILVYYLASQLKRLVKLIRLGVDPLLSALICGFIMMTIVFCIIDFPIYWVQTAVLFLFVLGSSDIYRKELA